MWTCDDLKSKARLSLTGKYWWAVLCTLVLSFLTGMATSVVSFISTIIFQIVGFIGTAVIGLGFTSAVPETRPITGFPTSFYYAIAFFLLVGSAVILLFYAMIFAVVIFVTAPLSLGYQKLFFDIREGGNGKKMDSLFMAFHKNTYGRMVKGMAWKTLWTFIWALTAIVPILVSSSIVLLLAFSRTYHAGNGSNELNGSEVIVFLILSFIYIAGFVWYLIIFLRKYYSYQFTPYLLIDDPSLGYREALKKSIAMSKGQILHMLVLDLSFIGWWLLVILTLGYGAIFLAPYTVASHTELYFARKAECQQSAVS